MWFSARPKSRHNGDIWRLIKLIASPDRWINSGRDAGFIAVMVNFYLESQGDVKESRAGRGNLQIFKEASLRPSSEKMDFLLLVPLLLQSSGCYEKSNLITGSSQRAVIQDIRQPCKCKKMGFFLSKWHCGKKWLLSRHTIDLCVRSFAIIVLLQFSFGEKRKGGVRQSVVLFLHFWFSYNIDERSILIGQKTSIHFV